MRLLVLAGPMQAGKSSAANYVGGLVLKNLGIIKKFKINESSGALEVESVVTINDEKQTFNGNWDFRRRDEEYVNGAKHAVWPHVKHYSFATKLKEFCIDVLGLNESDVFGTGEDKNKLTHIKWSSMPGVTCKEQFYNLFDEWTQDLDEDHGDPNFTLTYSDKEFMTVREVLQEVGTRLGRGIYPQCWVNACKNQIQADKSELSIIDDCRFENELDLEIPNVDKKVILFSGGPKSTHASEVGLDGIDKSKVDYVMPQKENLSLEEKHFNLNKALVQFGWIDLV